MGGVMLKCVVFIYQTVRRASRAISSVAKLAVASSWRCPLVAAAVACATFSNIQGCGTGEIFNDDAGSDGDNLDANTNTDPDTKPGEDPNADDGPNTDDGPNIDDDATPSSSDFAMGMKWKRMVYITNWGYQCAAWIHGAARQDECKELINTKTIPLLKYVHADVVALAISDRYLLARRNGSEPCTANTCAQDGISTFAKLDKRAEWDYYGWLIDRLHEENIAVILWGAMYHVSPPDYRSAGWYLWGKDDSGKGIYNAWDNPSGNARMPRVDLAYDVPRDWMVGMVKWLFDTYPIDGWMWEEPGYWVGDSECKTAGNCVSWSPPILECVQEKHGYQPDIATWNQQQLVDMQSCMEEAWLTLVRDVRRAVPRYYPDVFLAATVQMPLMPYGNDYKHNSVSFNTGQMSREKTLDGVIYEWGSTLGYRVDDPWEKVCTEIATIKARHEDVYVSKCVYVRVHESNAHFFDQISHMRECGAVFQTMWPIDSLVRTINGINVKEWLHENLPPRSECEERKTCR